MIKPAAWMKVENYIDDSGLWGQSISFNTDGDGVPLHVIPEGMALVPVDALNSIMELAGVALVYQPFGTKDRQHFDALLAATKEKGE